MHTTMLWRCGVFSTATRWSPTRLTWPSVLDRLGGVLQQGLLEGGIGPGLGDDLRAIVRADLGLVGLDDGVERGRLDIAFFGQDRLERAHAQLGLRQFRMVVIVVVMVVVMVAHGRKIGAKSGLCRGEDSASISAMGIRAGCIGLAAAAAIFGGLSAARSGAPPMAPMRSTPPTFPRSAPARSRAGCRWRPTPIFRRWPIHPAP